VYFSEFELPPTSAQILRFAQDDKTRNHSRQTWRPTYRQAAAEICRALPGGRTNASAATQQTYCPGITVIGMALAITGV
jgi:hypothetical protein